MQDLEQEAFLALLEALERWDEKAGPFLPWYSLRLKAAFTAATAQKTQRDRLDPGAGGPAAPPDKNQGKCHRAKGASGVETSFTE